MTQDHGSGQKDKSAGREARRLSLGLMIPTTFTASIVVGVGIGYGLDKWLGTAPWLTLLFLGFGIAAGVREMLSVLKKMDR